MWSTLSNAFAASKKTVCTQNRLSSAECHSWRRDRSCHSADRPFRNPNYSSGRRSLSRQWRTSWLSTKRSKTLETLLSKAIGRYDDNTEGSFPSLGWGHTNASLHGEGNNFVGCTLNGALSFLLNVYGRRISKKELTKGVVCW